MRPVALLLPAILVLAAACAATPPSTSPSAAAPTPTSSGAPTPVPSPSPVVPPSADPPPSAEPATPAATPSVSPSSPAPAPTPAMTADEAALLRLLRLDAAVGCAPRRTDLPKESLYGVECHLEDPLVDRVGIYAFRDANGAAWSYMNRMASYGVDVNAGDCVRDIPGDAPWTSGDGEGSWDDPGVFNWENSALTPNRSGCFRDENGKANVRATCGIAYIGILGRGSDLSDLNDWTWRYPKGYEPGTPDRPGICVRDATTEPGIPGA